MTEWNVVVKLKLMPKGVETDMESIKKKVEGLAGEKVKVHSMEIQPIAFGLKALEINMLFNDKLGGFDDIEEKIKQIEGVGEVETIDLNRL